MAVQFDDEREEKELGDLKKVEEEELVAMLAKEKYGIPSINLANMPIENDALRTIPEADAIKESVAPFRILGHELHVGVRSPTEEHLTQLREYFTKHGFNPHFYMVSLASLEKAWERYKEMSFAAESRMGGLDVSSTVIEEMSKRLQYLKDVKEEIEKTEKEKVHTTSHILEIVIAGAIALDASDIHFEPEEHTVRLRFRLDGILQEVTNIPPEIHKFLNSRIKLLAGVKISSHSTAQDGRFSIFLGKDEIDVRVSILPGAYGESIVLRILNPKSIRVGLEDLGIEPKLYDIFMREIKKPNGLILLTGPTGSGKTTTLYAFLQKIYSTELKIITIEDPIEYHLAGITQTQTDEEKGYTFLEGLRSVLRQDPDVIMVGEIRDGETANIAVESALTGHMVFSTLHTNNAAGVIPRLIDLGVNPKILVSALSLSIAQRLVRKLCVVCKKEKAMSDSEKKLITDIIDNAKKHNKDFAQYGADISGGMKMFAPVGCDKCNNTGYKGRIGIFEAILNDAAIEKIIPENPSEREIKTVAENQGILTMKEDGVVKILTGITSLEEVQDVVDFFED